jgi:hypothetical protein
MTELKGIHSVFNLTGTGLLLYIDYVIRGILHYMYLFVKLSLTAPELEVSIQTITNGKDIR